MATWTGGGKIHSSRKPPQNEEGWHQPVKDEDYWVKDANKDQFGFGTEQESLEEKKARITAAEEQTKNLFLNLENLSDVNREDVLDELTYGYMYEQTYEDPHENNKFILELMEKHGLKEDHSEPQQQRLNFWKEAVSEGYYKLKNPIFQKTLLEQ